MASLSLKNINKVYDNGVHAVKDFNLEIQDKEFVIFVGPSGCGKSTTSVSYTHLLTAWTPLSYTLLIFFNDRLAILISHFLANVHLNPLQTYVSTAFVHS